MAADGIIAATTAVNAYRPTFIDISLETLDVFYPTTQLSRNPIAINRLRFVALH